MPDPPETRETEADRQARLAAEWIELAVYARKAEDPGRWVQFATCENVIFADDRCLALASELEAAKEEVARMRKREEALVAGTADLWDDEPIGPTEFIPKR